MRKVFIGMLLYYLPISLSAQDIEALFDRANSLLIEEEYDSALLLYRKVRNKSYDPVMSAKAHYNIGVVYFEKEEDELARKTFLEILESEYNDTDRGGRGEGLLAEPYANYKNNSTRNLLFLALKKNDISTALFYLELYEKVYPYRHFCGNEYASNDIFIATMYATCYEKQGDKRRALEKLLPQSLSNGLASNAGLVEMTVRLIKELYSGSEIRNELDQALNNIHSRKKGNGRRKYDAFYTVLFGIEIPLRSSYLNFDKTTFERMQRMSDVEVKKYILVNEQLFNELLE